MKRTTFRRRMLAGSVLTGMLAATLPGAALAQDEPIALEDVAEDEEAVLDRVNVTGTRLNTNPNLVATSPVLTVDAELFQVRGTVDTVDLVNTLPSVFASQTTAFANGATGTSTVDLRGLGAVRTLTLVNGKRLPPGGPLAGFAGDLNLIPSQLVERTEVVTGGASAVYGSDAISGVVNFILRRDFEGFEVDGLVGFNQSNNNSPIFENALLAIGEDPVQGGVTDNLTFDVSAMWGSSLGNGRGNVTGYFRYLNNEGIQQGDRDFSRCATFTSGTDDLFCLGSNQGPFPTTFVVGAAFATPGDPTTAIGLTDAAGNPIDANGDGMQDISGAFSLNADDSLSTGFNNSFNFNPFNPIRRATERFNAGFTGYYNITDNIEAYGEFGFTSSNSPQIIAPSAAFGSSINQVNCDNPLLTSEQLAIICGLETSPGVFARDPDGDGFAQVEIRRRFVEGGPRTDDRTRTNFRFVGGLKGTLSNNFEWDVFGQFSQTSLQRTQFNQVTLQNLQQALDIITDPATGQPACRAAVDGTAPDCVPFTSAFQNGVASPAELPAFVDTPTLTNGQSQQAVFGATLQGDVGQYGIKSPFAADGVTALIGVEYRRDELIEQADGIASGGLLVGAGGAVTPTNARTRLWEIFTEVSVPLISDQPFIEQFNLTGAYRYSDYESRNFLTGVDGGQFGNSTFAVGASWVPVEDVRIRGQFQRAIRAPNVLELFDPQNTGLTSLSDPCAGFFNPAMPPAGTTLAGCQASGLPASLFGFVPPDSGQLNVLTGGNPNLVPEEADTFTVGVVIQPRQIEGLSVSVDYFNIDLTDAISTIPTAFTLNTCIDSQDPNNPFCALINRGPDGSLTFFPREQANIVATNQNIAGFGTQGIDFQVQYGYDFGSWGDVSLNYNSTYLIDITTQPLPTEAEFNCAGFFGDSCGNPNFSYRHNLQASWNTPWNVRANVLWRYFSGVSEVDSIANGVITTRDQAGDTVISSQLDSNSYVDVAMFYDLFDNVTLRAGVNNVFDNDPPIVTTFGTTGANIEANTIAGVFDAAGRYFFFGVNARF